VRREGLQPRLAFCFLKVPKPEIFFGESKLVLAQPALGGAGAQKSAQKAQKAQKAPAVGPDEVESAAGEAWKACPENMLDKRGMRGKGLPENTRTKRTMRTKVLRVQLRDLSVPRLGKFDHTLVRLEWRSSAESGIVRCKLVRTIRTKLPGRTAMPWMTRRRECRVIWISRVFLVDTPYRCEIGQFCRVSDSYFSTPKAIAV
jgi:hypothetical protein